MERENIMQVINTMNVAERQRALRGMHQAMVLGRLWDAAASTVQGMVRNVARVTSLAQGRTGK